MRTPLRFVPLFLLVMFSATAQVKIGDNPQTIDPASVLELESSSRVLVISRMNSAQMNSLSPLRGALVYNTDTQCVHYFEGAQWINLCEGLNGTTNESLEIVDGNLVLTDSEGNSVSVELESLSELTFSTDPIENFLESIIITQNGNNYNFEVGRINGFNNIQAASITALQLAENSVTQSELNARSVSEEKIDIGTDPGQVSLTDFPNDAGFITGADIVSGDTPNSITAGSDGGALYDDSGLQIQIDANSNALTLKEDQANKSTDTSLGNSDILYPTQNAVRTFVNNAISGSTQTIVSGNGGNSITPGSDGGAFFNATPLQNAIDANTTALTQKEDLANKSDNTNLGNSTTLYPTQNAVKTYVDNQIISSGGSTEEADLITIIGDGSPGNEFRINDNAINSARIQNGQVQNVDLQNNAVTTQKIADGTILGDDIDQQGATLNQVLKWNGATWIPANDEEGGGGTNFTAGDALTLDGANNLDVNVDNATIEINGVNALQVADSGITNAKLDDDSVDSSKIDNATILAEDFNRMGANDGEILKWSDAANAGLGGWITDFDNTSGTGIPTLTNGNILIGNGSNIPTEQIVGGDATMNNVGILTIADDAVTSAKIDDATIALADLSDMGAADGQVLKWNATTTAWEPAADDDGGTGFTDTEGDDGLSDFDPAAGYDVNVDGTTIAINATDQLELADDAVTSAKIDDATIALADLSDMGAADGQVLKWNATTTAWEPAADDDTGSVTGISGSVFFADNVTGALTENNGQLFWDQTGNRLGVGTNNPAIGVKLHVANGRTRTEGISNSDGTLSNPAYGFANDTDTNTGLYLPAQDQLGIVTGGLEAVNIREIGNDTETTINGSLELTEQLLDENGNTGNAGDVLTATTTGTEWKEPSVVAMGKANGANSIRVSGATVTGGGGINVVSLTTARPTDDYIIQLTVEGDNRIYVTSQNPGNFTVEIRNNVTNFLIVTEWHFTVLDF
ncbi:hypothetical protein [Allomuricauda sp. d1]|uniref:beta strand repeat-containing protein n=1 Tax=Allomuricauda sp. d1 TaxID=3136725 RepID=UPI0031DF44B0